MEALIQQLTIFPTLGFFTLWFVLFSLLFFSIIFGFDMDFGFDIDVDASPSFLPSFFISLGITKIPLLLSFFIVFTIGLLISLLVHWSFIDFFNGDNFTLQNAFGVLFMIPIFIASLYISCPILSFLGKYIENPEKIPPLDLMGMNCTVITGTVSLKFGEAIVQDGDKTYKINVISNDSLVLDDIAKIISPKNEDGDYLIQKNTKQQEEVE